MKQLALSFVICSVLLVPAAASAAELSPRDVRDSIREAIEAAAPGGLSEVTTLVNRPTDSGVSDDRIGFRGVIVGGLLGALGGLFGVLSFYTWIGYLGAAAVAVWLARRPVLGLLQDIGEGFWASAGRGVIYSLVIPLASLLLVMSVAGTIPGAMLFLAYFNAVLVSSVLGGIYLGSVLDRAMHGRPSLRLGWGSALGGVALYLIAAGIPVVGWFISVVLWLAALGVIGERVRARLRKLA